MEINFLQKIVRYYYTLKPLKIIQIYYQFFYRIKHQVLGNAHGGFTKIYPVLPQVNFTTNFIHNSNSFLGNNKFFLLNITHNFENNINWDITDYGKLWNYNLQYLDFINQEKISQSESLKLINSLRQAINTGNVANEPYPVSLRIMNLVKYSLFQDSKDEPLLLFLTEQIHFLKNNLEYHLLGNHLLEDGFALLIGGQFTGDQDVFEKGQKIIKKELKRQVLADGAHIELSPMYHSIILTRLLDCINLLNDCSEIGKKEFNQFLIVKASLMLGWLKKIQFKNGNLPHLNDSTDGISPASTEIFEYALRLNITFIEAKLKESGYRKFEKDRFEIVMDVGDVQPAYQPGHSHADTTNFVVSIDNKSFITDSGTSTYQQDEIRLYERSTSAHNAVTINGRNSSDVWGAFRVGRRSKIIDLVENPNSVSCKHDGYSNLGIIHEREFIISDSILIIDRLHKINRKANRIATKSAYLHFHPSIEIIIKNNFEVETSLANIVFENSEIIKILPYNYALGFNKRVLSKCLEIQFRKSLTTRIIPNF